MWRWLQNDTNARICALLGAVTIAFSSILVRLAHASPSTTAIFRCGYAVPVLGLLAFSEDRRLGRRSWHDRRYAVGAVRRGGTDLRRPAGLLFDATATAGVLCAIIGVIIGDADFVPRWPSAGWFIALALSSQVVGWLLITISLPRLPSALSSLLVTVQPVGSVVLGAIIFAESPTPLQLVGVALVLAGLLTATRRVRGRAAARAAESAT